MKATMERGPPQLHPPIFPLSPRSPTFPLSSGSSESVCSDFGFAEPEEEEENYDDDGADIWSVRSIMAGESLDGVAIGHNRKMINRWRQICGRDFLLNNRLRSGQQ